MDRIIAVRLTNIVNILERLCSSSTYKLYSSYGPHFINPKFKKEELDQIFESGEAEKIAHVPIKAALNYETSSVFHDDTTRKFMNQVMKCGNKALARDLVEKVFERVKLIQVKRYNNAPPEERELIERNPFKILNLAVKNSSPLLELSPVKRGGVRYQVPVPVTTNRSRFLAMKWLIEAGCDKHRRIHFPEQMAKELLEAAANQGRVVKKKVDLHKQCEANRAYAHYRWG